MIFNLNDVKKYIDKNDQRSISKDKKNIKQLDN